MTTDPINLDGMTPEGWIEYWKDRALKAEEKIEDLKDIGRAKNKLMKLGQLSEPDAHRYIQKTAMDSAQSMGTVARAILLAYEGGGYPAGFGSPQGSGEYHGA